MGTDAAAVQVYHRASDCQTEADPAEAVTARQAALIEREKNPLKQRRLDAHPRIINFNAQPPFTRGGFVFGGANGKFCRLPA